MMYSYGSVFPLIGMLHGIGALLFMLGLLALMAWAWKSWKPHDFKKAAMWLIGIGVILCAISIGVRVGMMSMNGDWGNTWGDGVLNGGKMMKSFNVQYDK